MKKYLSLLVMGLLVVLPFSVKAETTFDVTCGNVDSNGYKTCTVTAATEETELTVKLTEEGGADITDIQDRDWSVSSRNESDNVWTVVLSGMDGGEINLFNFTYKVSGQANCKVVLSSGTKSVPTVDEDKPTPQKQTGSSLPYIALGTIALLAGGAYVATKNKAKMYRL